jgi:aromatic ring-cleaving dioxygenase
MSEAASPTREIIGWHCHVYFELAQRERAVILNDKIQDNFSIWDYRWLNSANPLHPLPMFRFQFNRHELAQFVEWITLNRDGLSVLLHAITGDDIFDHSYNAMWLGQPLALDIDGLRKMQEQIARGDLPASLAPASQVQKSDKLPPGGRYRPEDDSHLR